MSLLALDGACLQAAYPTGVERAFARLLAAFAAAPDAPEILLFAPKDFAARAAAEPEYAPLLERPRLAFEALPPVPSAVWRRLLLPARLRALRPSLWLSPTAALPPQAPCPTAATVHELPQRIPGAAERPLRAFADERARAQLGQRADFVLVPSARTATALARAEPALAARIHVQPQALGRHFLAAAARPPRPPAERAGLVFVGAARRRKNLPRLFQAYASLPPALRARHPLLLIGGRSPGTDPGAARPAGGVVRLPPVGPARLVEILGRARALLLPSLSEGFGLPALEAAAVGTPVLAARDSVVTELCGPLAVAADPYDPDALAEGLHRLLEEDGPLERAIAEGPQRARRHGPAAGVAVWRSILAAARTRRHREAERNPPNREEPA